MENVPQSGSAQTALAAQLDCSEHLVNHRSRPFHVLQGPVYLAGMEKCNFQRANGEYPLE